MRQNKIYDPMLTIGVTGGVGAGKSRVLEYLQDCFGAVILKADEIGHDVMEPGNPCYEPVLRILGDGVVLPDGRIDRRAAAAIIFKDEEKRKAMNAVIHPAVKMIILGVLQRLKEQKQKLAVVEAALLLEDNYQVFLDDVWYVYADEEIRIKRLSESRGYSEEKSRDIMAGQTKDRTFRAQADFIIDNSGDFEDTKEQIKRKLTELL